MSIRAFFVNPRFSPAANLPPALGQWQCEQLGSPRPLRIFGIMPRLTLMTVHADKARCANLRLQVWGQRRAPDWDGVRGLKARAPTRAQGVGTLAPGGGLARPSRRGRKALICIALA